MDERTEKRYMEIKEDAEHGGYRLNDDRSFCLQLVEGLLKNADRYGMEACPCRLYMGNRAENLDIVCPCDYRDDDLAEYGACYCALYVNDKYDPAQQVPERRSPNPSDRQNPLRPATGKLPYPVWRCPVCGYLCANNNPPAQCPICKAAGERFTQFL